MKKKHRTEVKSDVLFINRLLEQVRNGHLRIPRFQRPFVWKQPDMLSLLESVVLGYPMGSILVWETNEEVSSLDWVGPVNVGGKPEGVVSYLLDGQQRVSTLLGTLQQSTDAQTKNATPPPRGVDEVDWRVYYDLEKLEFMRAPRDGVKVHHFPINRLLTTTDFLAECRRIGEEVEPGRAESFIQDADALANRFRDYQVPVITIKHADMDTAVAVFARLNLRGRRMTADEMVSALTYREGQFHLSKELTEYQSETLAPAGFGGLNRTFILRTVLAVMERDIYAKDWSDLMVKEEVRRQLPAAFKQATIALGRALEFLKELGATSDRLVPYGLQIVLLAEFFRYCSEPDEEKLGIMRRWFWVTSFTGWFGSVSTTRARRALEEVREVAKGKRTEFDVVDLDASALPFPDRVDTRSARVRAFMLYAASLKPTTIDDHATELEVGRLFAQLGPNAMRHIFSALDDKVLASSPANRVFVHESYKGQAFGAFEKLKPEENSSVLASHGFPPDAATLIKSNDRAGLIRGRLSNLIDGERNFMQKCGVKPAEERSAAVPIADSDMDES